VQKYGGIPPFKETQDYVRRVKLYQREMSHKKGIRLAMDSSQPVDQDYLPPESKNYYMIVLDNGYTIPAEEVYVDADRYVYTFQGRSGRVEQSAVTRIVNPA
jgi:hypothetical protein